MIVISDTSPVLNLARIGRLELLPALYYQVIIPEAVYEELTVSKGALPPAIDLASEPWLTIATPKDQARVQRLREDLDPGEAEAIVLAIERGADLLLSRDAALLNKIGQLNEANRRNENGVAGGRPFIQCLCSKRRQS